jgi:hypothetical protein
MRTFYLATLVVLLGSATARAEEPLSVHGAVQEVISRSSSPHISDWRQASYELELGYGFSAERNNFDSETYEAAAGFPTGSGSLFRLGLRHASVHSTPSSTDMGRTPFTQSAQSTRYEFFGGYGWGLLEGRSMTQLTPLLPDVENATFFWIGGHYSLPDATWLPQIGNTPARMPGQDQVNARFNLELGLRWHVYFPRSFGIYFEAMQVRPIGGAGDLHYWAYYSGGVLWAFGVH